MSEEPSLAERVAQLEARVAQLESAGTQVRVAGEVLDADTFWALEGLKERAEDPGMVLFTGAVSLPTGERREWQQGHPAAEVLADDWSQAATTLAALGHPVRLQLLREILHGVRTVADLSKTEQFGTTGQLYHHLRQLVSAGWLRTTARAQYAVPGERVIPLLTILTATRH